MVSELKIGISKFHEIEIPLLLFKSPKNILEGSYQFYVFLLLGIYLYWTRSILITLKRIQITVLVDKMSQDEPMTIALWVLIAHSKSLKAQKTRGFSILLICEEKRHSLYKRFRFIDEILTISHYDEALDSRCKQRLDNTKSIIIPHGTMISYFTYQDIENISVLRKSKDFPVGV